MKNASEGSGKHGAALEGRAGFPRAPFPADTARDELRGRTRQRTPPAVDPESLGLPSLLCSVLKRVCAVFSPGAALPPEPRPVRGRGHSLFQQ